MPDVAAARSKFAGGKRLAPPPVVPPKNGWAGIEAARLPLFVPPPSSPPPQPRTPPACPMPPVAGSAKTAMPPMGAGSSSSGSPSAVAAPVPGILPMAGRGGGKGGGKSSSGEGPSAVATSVSGILPMADGGGGKGEKKPPLACIVCLEVMPASKLLISGHAEVHDWQGSLSVYCYPCFKEKEDGEQDHLTESEFHKLCKKCWKTRALEAGKQYDLIRASSFRSAIAEVPRLEEESRREHRLRVIQVAAKLSKQLTKAYAKMNEADKQDLAQTFEWWEGEAIYQLIAAA